jgi:hypothetical protein
MPDEGTKVSAKEEKTVDSDVEELDDNDESEDEEIRLLSQKMEEELNASGALELDPTPNKLRTVLADSGKNKGKGKADSAIEHDDDDEDDEDESEGAVNIDYNLAKNMLEAFKGQTGMAGPAGNMMGMMGVQMPRDERERGDEKMKK